jgi:hypothetical protein
LRGPAHTRGTISQDLGGLTRGGNRIEPGWASVPEVLIDPLTREDLNEVAWEPFDEAISRASDRPAVVLLTAPWHERSARAGFGTLRRRSVDRSARESAHCGLPELAALPKGIEAFTPEGVDEAQVAFRIVAEETLVVAEFFLGTETGLRVLPSPTTRDLSAFLASLERLRDAPIERVLVAHGRPTFSDGRPPIRNALDAYSREHPSLRAGG